MKRVIYWRWAVFCGVLKSGFFNGVLYKSVSLGVCGVVCDEYICEVL